jgi:hypothetical protein
MLLAGDMGANPDSNIRCHIEVSRSRIWLVLIDRRGPVNGDAAQNKAKKEWHVQPVTPAHQDMVSFHDELCQQRARRARFMMKVH